MSLRVKIAVAMLLVGGSLIGAAVWQTLSIVFELEREEVGTERQILSQFLGDLSIEALSDGNTRRLQEAFQSIIRHDPRVLAVTLVGPDGRRLGAAEAPPEARSRLRGPTQTLTSQITGASGPIGTLRIRFGDDADPAYQGQAWWQVGGFGLSVLVLLSALGAVAAGLLTRRLRRLQTLVERVADGDFSIDLTVRGGDEIGRLGRSVNRMIAALLAERRRRTRNEERQRELINLSADLVWETNSAHEIVWYGGRQIGAEFGFGPEDVYGRTPWDINGVDLETSLDWKAHVEDHEKRRSFRNRLLRSENQNGEVHWFSVSGNPRFDSEGRFLGYRGSSIDVTERKQAEIAAAAAHIRLVDAFDSVRDALIHYDADDRFVLANEAYFRMFPKIRDECVGGRSFAEVAMARRKHGYESSSDDSDDDWLAARIAEHRTPIGAREVALPDGRWLLVNESRTREGGSVIATTDVTRLKEAQREAEMLHRRLLDAIESIGEAFIWFDADDRLVYANSRLDDFAANSSDVFRPGALYRDIMAARAASGDVLEAVGREQEWVEERLAWHRNPVGHFRVSFANGQMARISETRTADGGTVTVTSSVTAIERALQDAEQSRLRLLDAIESMDSAIAIFDADDRLVLSNDQFNALQHGNHDIYVAGRPFSEIVRDFAYGGVVHPFPGQEEEWIRERLDRHYNPRGPFEVRNVSGQVWRVSERRTREGGIVLIATNITAERRAEAEAREHLAELIHMQRNSSMDQLSAALAHEISQPIAAALNYVEAGRALLEQLDSEGNAETMARAHAHLGKAGGQIERVGDIITNLRRLLERGDIDPTPQDMNALIEDVSSLALIGVENAGTEVRFELAEGLPDVLANRVQVQQVLLNLVRNAFEAMDGSERRVLTIETRLEGDSVRVAVSDTGPGVPDDLQDALFEPFVSGKADGMGIGLSICRNIVRAHGGEIRVEPRPGGGTIISFTVPVAASEAMRIHA